MTTGRIRCLGSAAALALALGVAGCAPPADAQSGAKPVPAGSGKQAPIFEVDPFWPKPLPNHWVTGSTIGLVGGCRRTTCGPFTAPARWRTNFKAADLMVAMRV
jgi:hypothetical protein